jgi:ComF family protein
VSFLTIVDMVIPARCVCCGAIVPGGAPLCPECASGLEPLSGRRCDRCGVPLVSERRRCVRCRSRELAYDSHRAVFAYDGVARALIVAYKFGGRRSLAALLAGYLAAELETVATPGTVVVPVPASPRGRRRRGFDQVARLARELERRHGITVRRALVRRRGREQKRLDVSGRSRNLVGALRLRPRALPPRDSAGERLPSRVVLLDDVFTTGATINECARVLRAAGVQRVEAVTLAAD